MESVWKRKGVWQQRAGGEVMGYAASHGACDVMGSPLAVALFLPHPHPAPAPRHSDLPVISRKYLGIETN